LLWFGRHGFCADLNLQIYHRKRVCKSEVGKGFALHVKFGLTRTKRPRHWAWVWWWFSPKHFALEV